MRGAAPLLLLAVALSASSAMGEPSLPYTAFVTGTNVHVRSGPGMHYYPTDKLQKGDQVEVYRHDPGGWYAIRPPRNSFSWVSARHVEKTADGLGRTRDDQAVVRVGSRLSNIRDVVQVRLDPGEPVEILESFNGGGQTWYKIAPPSGEFRWMYGRYISTIAPDQTSAEGTRESFDSPPPRNPPRKPPPSASVPSPPPVARSAVSAAVANPPQAEPAGSPPAEPTAVLPPPRRDSWQTRGQPRPGDQPEQARRGGPDRGLPRPWQADRPAAVKEDFSQSGQQPLRSVPTASPSSAREQVTRLEQQLSIIVAEDPATWQFDELRNVASRLLVDSSTATQRGRVRHVLSKISQFEQIQQRRVQMGLAPALASRGRPATSGSPSAPAADRLAARSSTRSDWLKSSTRRPADPSPFDGVGTLRPVVSRRGNSPRYALVDNAGQVVSFVTPGPGVNLQPYLGRKIGIRGTRGYIPELRRTNVMARRITALEPPLVR